MEEQSVIRIMAALAQAHRLKVFRVLVVAGPAGLTPGTIAEGMQVPAATLSFHLKELVHAGLVTQERVGRTVYRADFGQMASGAGVPHRELLPGRALRARRGGLVRVLAGTRPVRHRDAHDHERPHPLHPQFGAHVLAEGMLNHLAATPGRNVRAYSAGSAPSGRINPFALEALAHAGIDATGFRSKSWEEFATAAAPRMRIVITVCDSAASETCPYWPGSPVKVHWAIRTPPVRQEVTRASAPRSSSLGRRSATACCSCWRCRSSRWTTPRCSARSSNSPARRHRKT